MVCFIPAFMQTSETELVTGIAKMVFGYAMHMLLVLLVSIQYETSHAMYNTCSGGSASGKVALFSKLEAH